MPLGAILHCPTHAAELPDVRTSTAVVSITRDHKKRNVTVVTASGQKTTYVQFAAQLLRLVPD